MSVSNAPAPPLLRLPPHLRHRIYFLAGLAPLDWDGLPTLFDLHGDSDVSRLGVYGLLLSCRAIYKEASALLYSLNRFVIRMPPNSQFAMYLPQSTGLAPLRALTASSLASLRHLKIVINEASCHPQSTIFPNTEYSDCDGPRLYFPPCGCRWRQNAAHDGPLRAADAFTEATLSEWQSTATVLASRGVSLANLELSFICDVRCDGPQVAQLAVAPLASLGPLKHCHVRLCAQKNTEIQEIAHNAAQRARGIALQPLPVVSSLPEKSRNGSRLLVLPREIRVRILEYTDLITPWKEVTWDRLSAKYTASRIGCDNLEGRETTCAPGVHHGCQFSRCWRNYPEPSIGCFCRLRHSASSSKCRCWGSPLALFLVCRALYEEAQVVFFSGNRFVVHDFDSSNPGLTPDPRPGGGYPNERFSISIFLRDVVPDSCLGLLRFVEIVFPPYRYDCWPGPDDPALEDWRNCIDWVQHKVNAPALTLRLCMADWSYIDTQWDRPEITHETRREILSAYTRILGPLSQLGSIGIANLYANFVFPWTWKQVIQRRVARAGGWRWLTRVEARLKERAERWVMGDRYDTLYTNREEPSESLWKISFDRDLRA